MTLILTSDFQNGAGDQRGVHSHMLRWVFMWMYCHIKNVMCQSPSIGHIWALTVTNPLLHHQRESHSQSVPVIPCTVQGHCYFRCHLAFRWRRPSKLEFWVQSLFYVRKVTVLRPRAIALRLLSNEFACIFVLYLVSSLAPEGRTRSFRLGLHQCTNGGIFFSSSCHQVGEFSYCSYSHFPQLVWIYTFPYVHYIKFEK